MDIAVTGAKGFIGSTVVDYLRRHGHKIYPCDIEDRNDFLKWLETDPEIYAIVHLGACADTTCQDRELLKELNTDYSKELWSYCAKRRKKFIYASSAATYGDGSQGFDDLTEKLSTLKPLNPYAESKHEFDLWAIQNAQACHAPPAFAGLKFFNVYGANEQGKGKMASMVYQAIQQAKSTGKVRLFKHGEQKRDFIYVGDVCKIIDHMLSYRCYAVYNVGTGKAISFNEMARAVLKVVTGKEDGIQYFDMPASLKGAYQDFTEAKLDKLTRTDYSQRPTSIEEGVNEILRQS